MGTYEKIKVYLLKKVEYWYIVFALLAVMEIMNDGFASFAGFAWVYPCVSIVLVIFAAIYASILYGNWREQCKAYMDHRQDALLNRFDSIERHMQALHEQECQFINQWAQTLQDKIMAEMKIIAESSAGIAEKQLASLEKNMEAYCHEEAGSLHAAVSQGFVAQGKRAAGDADTLRRQIEHMEAYWTEKLRLRQEEINGGFLNLAEKAEQNQKLEDGRHGELRQLLLENKASVARGFKENQNSQGEWMLAQEERLQGAADKLAQAIHDKSVRDDEAREVIRSMLLAQVEESKSLGEEMLQRQRREMETAAHRLESQIAEASGEKTRLLENLDTSIHSLHESVEADRLQMEDSFSALSDQFIDKLETAVAVEKEYFAAQDEKIQAIVKQIERGGRQADEKTEAIHAKLMEAQRETTRLLSYILNKNDENAKKAETSCQQAFSQVMDFSTDIRKEIEEARHILEVQKQNLEVDGKPVGRLVGEYISKICGLDGKFDAYVKEAAKQQDEVTGRLENLLNHALHLNALAEFFKNIFESSQKKEAAREQEKSKADPDRIEEIKDAGTDTFVKNHYKANKLVYSEMFSGGKKVYEIEYNAQGGRARSCNWQDGQITELRFYENGEVETRMEIIYVKGKEQIKISRFDKQGKKLKM